MHDLTIGELAPFSYGKGLPKSKRVSGDIPVYGSNGIIGYHNEPLTHGPTIVVGRKGTVGALRLSQTPCWPIDTTFFIEFEELDMARFIYYVLSKVGLEQMNSDSAVPGLNRDAAHAQRLSLPNEDFWLPIAGVLGTLDDKIEQNRQTAQALEQLARAIFRVWFVDFAPVKAKANGARSFPSMPQHVFDALPTNFVDSEIGPVPEGWHSGLLGDVIDIHNFRRVPLSRREREQRKGSFRYYGATGIIDHVNDFLFDGVFVLVGEDGTVVNDQDRPVVQYVWGKFWVNNHAHVLTGSSGISTEYLRVLLDHINIRPFLTGAVQPKLNQRNLKSVPILIPPSVAVAAFGDVIAPLFACLRQVQDQSHVLESIRDLLLPQLLSGQIRLEAVDG